MQTAYRLNLGLCFFVLVATVASSKNASAQQSPFFAPGNLVVVASGCGVQGGTCTISGGTGDGTGNSTSGGYGDNQGTPLTLFQFAPTGTASATYVNSLVLPQAPSGSNFPVSAEYGSSSEGTIQLSGSGQYLTVMGYGINAATYNASPATYGTLASKPTALAQSGSLTGQSYTPIGRVIALIDANGNVNSTSSIFNVFNLNNPRSIYTADGFKAYISGQGSGSDATGGVFYTPLFTVNNAPTAITGLDTSANTVSQDTKTVQIYNNTLYVSVDTKGGSNNARSFIGTLGTPPATSLFNNSAGPTQLKTYNNAATPVSVTSSGKLVLTASETNGLNSTGQTINLSPSGYFFANATTLYVADTGNPKQDSAGSGGGSYLGDGGLQKWVNIGGKWELMYTLSAGLSLVQNPAANSNDTAGTTGLYSLAGVVSGGNVYLYATNFTIGDLDQTYLYGITDSLAATSNSSSFTKLATAPPDTNFKGVSFAPSYPAGSATITTVPSGLSITTAGTGCVPGTYVTPVTLAWTPSSVCTLSTTTPQSPNSAYVFSQWQDGTTSTTDSVIAPSTSATYTATFTSTYQPIGVLERAVDNSTASTSVLQGDSLLVSGWVADQVDGSPLGNVKVYIDGTLFGTPTTGISRPDVASTYNNSAYTNSGYQLVASTSSLSLGYHNVTVVAVDSTARSTTFGPLKINLVSAPPAYVFLAGSGSVGSLGGNGAQTSAAVAGGGTGAAVDASGYVWSINSNGTSLSSFTPAGALSASYSPSGITGSSALAIDGGSNIVVANGNGSVSIVSNAGTAASITQGSTSAAPSALAIDTSGDIWVANPSVSTVDEIIGGAAPVAPLANAVKATSPGTKP